MRSLARLLPLVLLSAFLSCADEPDQPVRIVVDRLGISHVYGRTDADAFYGAGYAMARDRLFQMDLNRRQALGEMSEVLGDSHFNGDLAARAFNFRQLGAADAARGFRERPEDFALVVAWVAGVNERIREVRAGEAPRPYGLGPAELDYVPRDFTVEDASAIGKTLSYGNSSSLEPEILATIFRADPSGFVDKFPTLQPSRDVFPIPRVAPAQRLGRAPRPSAPAPFTGPPAERQERVPEFHLSHPRIGSNNWAVDGAHSTNGRPLLAGDPHQPLNSPTKLWPFHMSSVQGSGTLDVMGFAFVGAPTVQLGHNAHIGWTATTNFADAMDMWSVRHNASAGTVEVGRTVSPVQTRREIIRVKTAGGTVEERKRDCFDVPGYGILFPAELLPIDVTFLSAHPGVQNAILLNWTGFAPTLELSTFLAIDRARNMDEFEAAIDTMQVGAVNFVGADRSSISYHVHADVPDRGDPSAHSMPWYILDGRETATFWTGAMLPPEKLPHLRDPARGFVATANTDPFGFTQNGRVEDDPWYYGAFFDKGHRLARIEQRLTEMLAQGGRVSRAEMQALQSDVYSPVSDSVLPRLRHALSVMDANPTYRARPGLKALGDAIAGWDHRFDRDRGEPVAYLGLEWFTAQRLLRAAGMPAQIFDAISGQQPPYLLGLMENALNGRFDGAEALYASEGGPDGLLLSALSDTEGWLTAAFGTTDPSAFRLRDIHGADFPSEYGKRLTVPSAPVSGSGDTVHVSEAPFFSGGKPLARFSSQSMSLYRMVMAFGDDGVPEATVNFPRGTREDPDDPHFGDREAEWENDAYVPLPFRRTEVEASATERVNVPSGP